MSTASRLVLAVISLALLAVGAVALGSTVFHRTDQRSRVMRGTVSRIVVSADNGDVAMQSGPEGRVTVRERRHFWWRKPKLDLSLSGGVLKVRAHCGGFATRCSDDLDITVPRGLAQASVAVDAGDVALAGIDSRSVDAFSDSGDLELDGFAGDARLGTDSGDVVARDLRGAVVAASTDSGDVSLRLLAAPRSLSAHSDSGDVDVDLPRDRYRVDATTDSGDVSVDNVVRDDTAARRIEARADSGDVSVRGR